ncbi:sulfatase [uncultured Rubinisphaera sp.]|uniref:sulfatase n=1 Tax=uncultured Rubinisphaera sp. TaxID=1678686 RepID=UPI0030D88499
MANFFKPSILNSAFFVFVVLFCQIAGIASESIPSQPNILVIAIDDLNDWIGCLNEHPQVKTPHLDRLSSQGILFENAHVQATFCAPSRTSLLSGKMPKTTGCFEFTPRYDQADTLKGHDPWPMWLGKSGYKTYGGGKIFHEGTGTGWTAQSFQNVIPSGPNPRPEEIQHWPVRVWDWGAYPDSEADMGDFKLAQNTRKLLEKTHEQPFLMVAGFRRPHVPLHVPERWFAMYPEETIVLPNIPANDLDDVPHPEVGLTSHRAPEHADLVEKKLQKSLTQAYLASISFVDHCVGEVLQGLEAGPNQKNTIVILWSDHGFHLGEKQHWAKRTLWEETTRIPLIITGPGIQAGQRIQKPVGLIDLYPTIADLIERKPPAGLEGVSLLPVLKGDPDFQRPPVITSLSVDDHAVRSRDFRYIRYSDGSEELYDHHTDPNEFKNLADDPKYDTLKQELANYLD